MWHTPAESLNLNPIENFAQAEGVHTTKQKLVDGINAFWDTVDENEMSPCTTMHINRLYKVIPCVIGKKMVMLQDVN